MDVLTATTFGIELDTQTDQENPIYKNIADVLNNITFFNNPGIFFMCEY